MGPYGSLWVPMGPYAHGAPIINIGSAAEGRAPGPAWARFGIGLEQGPLWARAQGPNWAP